MGSTFAANWLFWRLILAQPWQQTPRPDNWGTPCIVLIETGNWQVTRRVHRLAVEAGELAAWIALERHHTASNFSAWSWCTALVSLLPRRRVSAECRRLRVMIVG